MERRKLVECVSIVDNVEEDMPLFVPFGFEEKIPICMLMIECDRVSLYRVALSQLVFLQE